MYYVVKNSAGKLSIRQLDFGFKVSEELRQTIHLPLRGETVLSGSPPASLAMQLSHWQLKLLFHLMIGRISQAGRNWRKRISWLWLRPVHRSLTNVFIPLDRVIS